MGVSVPLSFYFEIPVCAATGVDTFEIFIDGTPRPWQRNPVSRGRFITRKHPWYYFVLGEAEAAKPIEPFDGPLRALLAFTLKSEAKIKKGFHWAAVTPDWDNLGKLVSDALEKAGVVHNDSRFVDVTVTKRYGMNPGVAIKIFKLEDPHPSHPNLPLEK